MKLNSTDHTHRPHPPTHQVHFKLKFNLPFCAYLVHWWAPGDIYHWEAEDTIFQPPRDTAGKSRCYHPPHCRHSNDPSANA